MDTRLLLVLCTIALLCSCATAPAPADEARLTTQSAAVEGDSDEASDVTVVAEAGDSSDDTALPDTVRRIEQVQYRPETEDVHATLLTAQNFEAETFATRVMGPAPQAPDFDTEYVVGVAAPEAAADTRFEATGLTIDGTTATLKMTLQRVEPDKTSVVVRPNRIYAIRKADGIERIVVEVDGKAIATLTP